jgi:hypothetical protein
MAKQILKAPIVLLTILVLLAVLFGPLAAAIEPLFDVLLDSQYVTESGPGPGPGVIERISSVLFVQAPTVYLGVGVLFLIITALKFEGVLR